MLVLTRKINQSIKIGNNIEVTLVEIRGDQIRLGFTAPGDVFVDRKEIWLQKQKEKQTEKQAEKQTDQGNK